MKDAEDQLVFKQCNRFFNNHYPVNMGDQLIALANIVSVDEKKDFYGTGKIIEDFEQEVALILGKPKALFMPSGTMAQVIALRIWSDQILNSNIGLHSTSHLENHEQKAYMFLHNLNGNLLGEHSRVISLSDIQKVKEKLSVIVIELPQRESGGLLPVWEQLEAISNWCKMNKIRLHLDGARLWECGPYYQKSYSEICVLFDSVYVSFYKGLGGMAGAILAGTEDFINDAKIWQRRQGGNLITLFPYVLSARASLHLRLERMKSYYDKAREVASIISTIDKIKIEPVIPQTNMLHIYFEGNIKQLEEASLEVARSEKILVFRKLQSTTNSSIGKFELSVGDAILDISNEDIYRIMKKIVKS